jgi:hypothetical protein
MATKQKESGTVEAVCLRDCSFGAVGQVVTLDQETAKVGQENGSIDVHADAVKHAKSK